MTPSILIVEDDKELLSYLKDLLIQSGYSVKTASTGVAAMNSLNEQVPDLVVLDLVLPDMQGESLCVEIKKTNSSLPVVILTSKDSLSEKVQGLNLGADDYITKPFASEELLARVKARLRSQMPTEDILKVADLEVDTKKIEVKRAGKNISLTPHEFRLLEYLVQNKGSVLTRDMILNRIWDYPLDVESRVVDVYVGYLRKKIDRGNKKKLISSVRGFGYTIKEES